MPVGARLKEERKRLGLTQADMADHCGVGRRAQISFEQSDQMPGGAYLQSASALGMDVLYVLTGDRHGITQEEARLLAAYRAAPVDVRLAVVGALGAVVKASAAKQKQIVHEAGQVLQGEISQPNLSITVGGKGKKKRG